MLTLLLTVLIFGCLILIHELGHYLFARLFDVAITEFAVGMGPKLFSRVSKKTGIRYSLRLIPFGGYVSMVGEDEASEDDRAFCNKATWKRMIITVAGATMNLLLGFILMTGYVSTYPMYGTTVLADLENSVLKEHAQVGDEIVEIDGHNVYTANDLIYEIFRLGVEPVDVVLLRDGKEIIVENVQFPVTNENGIAAGMYDFKIYGKEKSFGEVLRQSVFQSRLSGKMVYESLWDLMTGRYGMEAVSGPIGTGEVIGEAVQNDRETGGYSLLYLCAVITINLGIFNLLPIPALDGGRLFFQLIELIRRKPINRKYEGYIHAAGMALLLLLMALITFKDIIKLFT
ncbi:MAG: site-2 protease family protein [Ruminococcaceae bacterium]|nr:site-2 protease family protein [Oscillospiraceae bacterium]